MNFKSKGVETKSTKESWHAAKNWDELPLREQLDTAEYKKLERSARLKIDLQVVPICLLLYLLSFLDKSNISQAVIDGEKQPDGSIKNPGIMTSLGLSPHDYAVALTVLYPPYMAFEIPSNLMIKRVTPRIWIPLLVIAWGLVETLQGLVTSRAGLYINRVFLGAAEAGIMPGIAVYLTFFYKPSELQFRQAFFFTGASLSGAFSGLLATAIRKMDGIAGQHGWQWVFYLEGIFTVLVGFLCFFLLPNRPESCFLLTSKERRIVVERLSEARETYRDRPELALRLEQTVPDVSEEQAPPPVPSPWHREVLRAFRDIRLLLLGALGFCVSMSIFSVAYFMPTIVKEMGDYSAAQAMLMSCPPYAVSFAYSLIVAVASDRLRMRYASIMIGLVLCVIGFAVVLGCERSMVRYGGIIMLTCGGYAGPPCLFAWAANNSAGHYKRATALALIIILDNCSGLASSWLFNSKTEAPRFTRGVATNLAVAAFGLIVATAIELLVYYERKQRKSGRRDDRVIELYKKTGWSPEQLRDYMGDDHPEYYLEM